jgi:hypothetical protein
VEAYIKDLLAKKVIRECNDSQTISRILFVRKKCTSKLRVYIVLDAKEANSHLRPVKARLMYVEEVLAGIDPDATVYSVVDLLSGFWSYAESTIGRGSFLTKQFPNIWAVLVL